MGTIAMALKSHKPLLAIPHMNRYEEHVNDHQVATARKFEEFGHILVAYDTEDLPDGVRRLKNFIPRKREANPGAIADRIGRFLRNLSESHKSRAND
jgi:UDP-N-acetylglucosamine transferase subunit ALG13